MPVPDERRELSKEEWENLESFIKDLVPALGIGKIRDTYLNDFASKNKELEEHWKHKEIKKPKTIHRTKVPNEYRHEDMPNNSPHNEAWILNHEEFDRVIDEGFYELDPHFSLERPEWVQLRAIIHINEKNLPNKDRLHWLWVTNIYNIPRDDYVAFRKGHPTNKYDLAQIYQLTRVEQKEVRISYYEAQRVPCE